MWIVDPTISVRNGLTALCIRFKRQCKVKRRPLTKLGLHTDLSDMPLHNLFVNMLAVARLWRTDISSSFFKIV